MNELFTAYGAPEEDMPKNLGYKLTTDGYDMSEQVQNVKNI